jgi:hypothetical protein
MADQDNQTLAVTTPEDELPTCEAHPNGSREGAAESDAPAIASVANCFPHLLDQNCRSFRCITHFLFLAPAY